MCITTIFQIEENTRVKIRITVSTINFFYENQRFFESKHLLISFRNCPIDQNNIHNSLCFYGLGYLVYRSYTR